MKGWALQDSLFPVQPAYATGLFFLFMLADRGRRIGRVSKWTGDVSYSLYLLHVPVGFVAAAFFYTRFGITTMVVGGVAAALLSAHILRVTVEKPSQRLVRRLLDE